jgi:hypothetical protein
MSEICRSEPLTVLFYHKGAPVVYLNLKKRLPFLEKAVPEPRGAAAPVYFTRSLTAGRDPAWPFAVPWQAPCGARGHDSRTENPTRVPDYEMWGITEDWRTSQVTYKHSIGELNSIVKQNGKKIVRSSEESPDERFSSPGITW